MNTYTKHRTCEFCGKEIDYEPCQYCGKISTHHHNYPDALPVGSVLGGQYIVQDVIGSGGFGITYLGYHFQERRYVAIKEFYPKQLVQRGPDVTTVCVTNSGNNPAYQAGKDKFFREAKILASLSRYPGIVKIEGFFYENNTAYMIMEYLEGIDLKHYLCPPGGGGNRHLDDGQIAHIMMSVASSLSILHSNMDGKSIILHRDIAPDNIFLCFDGSVKLIDFGSARNVILDQVPSLSVFIKQGFTPFEQYQRNGNQGPWTDIYSLGATAFYAATGKLLEVAAPNRENDRILDIIRNTSRLYRVIRKCTEFQPQNRYTNVIALYSDLEKLNIQPVPIFNATPQESVVPASGGEPSKPPNPQPPAPIPPNPPFDVKQLLMVLGISALTLLLMTIVIIILMSLQ